MLLILFYFRLFTESNLYYMLINKTEVSLTIIVYLHKHIHTLYVQRKVH